MNVRYGMVWGGMVCYGMVWHGTDRVVGLGGGAGRGRLHVRRHGVGRPTSWRLHRTWHRSTVARSIIFRCPKNTAEEYCDEGASVAAAASVQHGRRRGEEERLRDSGGVNFVRVGSFGVLEGDRERGSWTI